MRDPSPLKRKNDADAAPSKRTKPVENAAISSFFKPPTSNSNSTSTSTSNSNPSDSGNAASKRPPFDKTAWAAANLDADARELLKLEIDTLDPTWFAELKDHLKSSEFLSLKRFLAAEARSGVKVFPPPADVYSWSRHTPLDKVKVVVLGQDPYHNDNQAHGLSFSVKHPTPAPPSLVNIYKTIKADYPSFSPPPKRAGDLTAWADQGVLLLNTCLTVRAHQANSHAGKGWESLTQRVVDAVARKGRGGSKKGVVFLAWGAAAQKRCDRIKDMLKSEEKSATAVDRHLILKAVHPSPLSASRGFFTCRHFIQANEWLAQRYGPDGVIDWNLTPGAPAAGPATTTTTAPPEKDPSKTEDTAGVKDSKDVEESIKPQEPPKTPTPEQEKQPAKGQDAPEDDEIGFDSDDDSEIVALLSSPGPQ